MHEVKLLSLCCTCRDLCDNTCLGTQHLIPLFLEQPLFGALALCEALSFALSHIHLAVDALA